MNEQEEKVSKTKKLTYHKVDLTGREEADIQGVFLCALPSVHPEFGIIIIVCVGRLKLRDMTCLTSQLEKGLCSPLSFQNS